MKILIKILLFSFVLINIFLPHAIAQENIISNENKSHDNISKTLYSGLPNHVELVERSFDLAIEAGFSDTSGIKLDEILARLKAGAFSEDYENIPGILGEHFPDPWNDVPVYDFYGLYPITTIPFGSIADTLSGWYRGLPHGYDPVKGYIWPGANITTIEWADSAINIFTWDHAVELYITGKKAEAYECLGHILHLLEDLSVPAHVKVINHRISIDKLKSGTVIDPDLLNLIVDEYELAFAGGVTYKNVTVLIPDLHDDFLKALDSAKTQNIPIFNKWKDYLTNLAVYTYNDKTVNQYYNGPISEGKWGYIKDKNGNIVQPVKYGITPISQIGDRWVQITLMCTATIPNEAFIPESSMVKMCYSLVPKAAEYGAGLLIYFLNQTKIVNVININKSQYQYKLFQNYPNPFNPTTTIIYSIPKTSLVTIKVYDILGREVKTLVNGQKLPGNYSIEFNAKNLQSGVYFYRLQTNGFIDTKKFILLK